MTTSCSIHRHFTDGPTCEKCAAGEPPFVPPTYRDTASARTMTERDEADRRLGKAVREAIVTGGVGADEPGEIEGYAGSLREDKSFWAASILDAIAAALREETKS